MFGQNSRFKKGFVEAPYLVVNSVFSTIQGEGPFAGTPAMFVRLSQCNLACTFCDTEFEKGEKMMSHKVMEAIIHEESSSGFKHQMLVLTGGEPLLQDVRDLIERYNRFYPTHPVQIETAGTVWQDNLKNLCEKNILHIVCSPKTPVVHKAMAQYANAWKYIVSAETTIDGADGLPVTATQPEQTTPVHLARPTNNSPVYIQPMDEQDEDKNVTNAHFCAEVAMRHGYKLSLQVHKQLNLP